MGEASQNDPLYIHIGQRIRARRQQLGISQDRLGKAVGVTYQQIQKYEKAKAAISASRLYRVSKALDKPIGWFYPQDNAAPHPLNTNT